MMDNAALRMSARTFALEHSFLSLIPIWRQFIFADEQRLHVV